MILLYAETSPNHSCALNDGILASSGSHTLILNPGDYILPDALEFLTRLDFTDNIIYFFNVISDNRSVGFVGKSSFTGRISDFVRRIGIRSYLSMPHQGLIAPKSLSLNSNVWYKHKYRIRMDYDFLANVAKNASQYNVQYYPLSLTYYPPGGKSMLKKNRVRFYWEAASINLKYSHITEIIPNLFKTIFWGLIKHVSV